MILLIVVGLFFGRALPILAPQHLGTVRAGARVVLLILLFWS